MNTVVRKILAPLAAVLMVGSGAVMAGPVIIDGTDANDHGDVTGMVNEDGWLYMQKVLENLASELTVQAIPFKKTVTVLGMTVGGGTQAQDAIQSAFSESSLAGTWTLNYVGTGVANGTALDGLDLATNTGILYIPTSGLTDGDMSNADLTGQVNPNATDIAAFVNSGGALFAMGETGDGAYGWLTSLLPDIMVTDVGGGFAGDSPITLTPTGVAEFPGLTSADLSAGPWHNYFSGDLGSLSVLGTSPLPADELTRNIIIGGGAGTMIVSVPEPGTLLLIGLGLMLLSTTARFRRDS